MGLLLRVSPFLVIGCQVICALHALKRNNDRWLWFIIVFPGIGCLIYFFSEILPGLRGSLRAGSKPAVSGAHPLEFIPWFRDRHLRNLEAEVAFADTVANRTVLAEAYTRAGRSEEAAGQYRECLAGPFAKDTELLLALARIQQTLQDYPGMWDTVRKFQIADADPRRNEWRLLGAVALEGIDRVAEAERLYRDLLETWPGEEVRARLAALLDEKGESGETRELYRSIRAGARRSSGFYRRQNRQWINMAKEWLRADEQAAR